MFLKEVSYSHTRLSYKAAFITIQTLYIIGVCVGGESVHINSWWLWLWGKTVLESLCGKI